jgi:hypothetical protein
MTADTLNTEFPVRSAFRTLTIARKSGLRHGRAWTVGAFLVGLLTLAGCKSDKTASNGTGVSRTKDKDPLVYGPTRIPKQDLPVPDRATGPKGVADPLTTPTGTGGKAGYGYTDDPERFKGTYIPGKGSTPASLAGRIKDGDELKIDSPGVPLTPAGGTLPAGGLEAPADVEPLYAQLDKLGVKREDRFLERSGTQWEFRASLVISSTGAKRQYVGVGPTAAEAIQRVLDQLKTEK